MTPPPDGSPSCEYHQKFQDDCIECVDNEIDRRDQRNAADAPAPSPAPQRIEIYEANGFTSPLQSVGLLLERTRKAEERVAALEAALTELELEKGVKE